MATISICNVDKAYNDNLVVKDLSLDLAGGTFTSILGPSGCGKTTLLRMIAGFMSPDRGEIRVDGKLLSSPSRAVPPERRGMGMVFQQYAIWPHMNVFENVAFGLEMAKTAKAEIPDRVSTALATVGLQGYEQRGSGELSGGQQQRLALARALVTQPSVLLLDEPLSNLDARLREHMRFELRALQEETGITFVYVTHDQVEAMSMSDSIAIMRSGVVAQQGAPEELYQAPASEFVVDFLGMTNWFDGKVSAIEDEGETAVVKLKRGNTITGTAAPGLTVGQPARVAVRPEDFSPTERPESENVLLGTVGSSLFMGSFVHHYVAVPGREEEVIVQTGRGHRLDRGAPVRLYAAPQLTRVVPGEGSIEREAAASVRGAA